MRVFKSGHPRGGTLRQAGMEGQIKVGAGKTEGCTETNRLVIQTPQHTQWRNSHSTNAS